MSDGSSIKTITRRTALGALAVGGAGLAVWPYAPRTRREIPSGRIVITYWEKWTGPEGDALQRVIDHFNATQDRIWVHRVPVNAIEAKAMLAIGGDDAPDLVGLFNFHIPQFAESKALIPLDSFPSVPELQESHYAAPVWRMLTHEGRLCAGVTTCHTLALYYNRGLFRAAGLDPDRPPRTIAELDETAQRLTRRDSGGRLESVGFVQNLPHWWPYVWPIPFGGPLFDAATNQATLLDERTIAAFEWIRRTPEMYGRDEIRPFIEASARSFHSTNDPLFSGRVAMIVQGPWMANFARRFAPQLDYGCTPMPTSPSHITSAEPTGLLEADVIVIPRGAPHPEEAFEFLCYLQRQEIQEQLATEHCKGSPLRVTTEAFRADHPNRYVGIHDTIANSSAVRIAPPTRVWPEYAILIQGAFDAVWNGADVRTTLTPVQARVQELLDTVARRREERERRFGASEVTG